MITLEKKLSDEIGRCQGCNNYRHDQRYFVNGVQIGKERSNVATVFRLCGYCIKELKELIDKDAFQHQTAGI